MSKESESFKQLREQLSEMFQLDRGDLDFGIYRIMNQKRDEITQFLEKRLMPQVRETLNKYQASDHGSTKEELDRTIKNLKEAEIDPNESNKVIKLRERLNQHIDTAKVETEIYSDLYNFFKRYYSEGDFMSMRRYKEGVYAIPYEGEEVKLHWANHDQYYIKTSENLKHYSFKTEVGRKVRFELKEASTEQNNNKVANGKARRFMLHDEGNPVEADDNNMTIYFNYRLVEDNRKKQEEHNKGAVEKLLKDKKVKAFGLDAQAPTEKNTERTLLERHLTQYTAKNSFDYFIHKDLDKFLRRELDFYIKNEIMHLDDIEDETAERAERYLAKIKAMRRVANKIIQFLAQLEDFQKKLWLKKKFVLETHYCVTLDHIIGSSMENELLPAIAKNKQQIQEWKKLFAIEDVKGDQAKLTTKFLKGNDKLPIDTKFFSTDFKYKMLSIFDNIDQQTNGLLISSENFQALNLLHARYKEKVDAYYADPPYNTAASEILYKNNYKDSSWLSFIQDRISLGAKLLDRTGFSIITIDYAEAFNLGKVADQMFGSDNRVGIVTVLINPKGRNQVKFFSSSTEYMLVYAKDTDYGYFNKAIIDDSKALEFDLVDDGGKYRLDKFARIRKSANREAKPDFFYPIYVSPDLTKLTLDKKKGYHMVLPEDNGSHYTWKIIPTSFEENNRKGLYVAKMEGDKVCIYNKYYEQQVYPNIWTDKKYFPEFQGTQLLKNMNLDFSYSKSVHAVHDVLKIVAPNNGLVMDFFAGSGTTGHAVINLNREDGGTRKYILVEMGEYFDSVTKPRVQKAAYSKDWKDGNPVSSEGVSQIIKYISLEQYEDTLDNLTLGKSTGQADLLGNNADLNEQYMLGYMLDVESRGSQSLLNIDAFANPFAYNLSITRNDETKSVAVDLVETFNYLIGLQVHTVRSDESGIVVVTGINSLDENCLVIWRNTDDVDNDALDKWFAKNHISDGFNFDVVYVNGDNNIERLKADDAVWTSRLIEAEFKRLMFEAQDA